jgi:dTMP kinase
VLQYDVSFSTTLKTNPYPGLFIAVEGIDGSGKTTQVKKLQGYFERHGKKVSVIHWPRREEGIVAQITKTMLSGTSAIPKPAFQYLLSADYVAFSEEFIIPTLKRGDILITDRCHFWSGAVYGMIDNGTVDPRLLDSLLVLLGVTTNAYQCIIPDLTFYLAISAQTGMKRIPQTDKERDIYEKLGTLEKIVAGYSWLLQKLPEHFVTIDAEVELEEVAEAMISSYEATFAKR